MQDAFIALHRNWRRLREPGAAPAWLRRAVVSGSRGSLRRRATARRHLKVVEPSLAGGPDDDAVLADEHRAVAVALRALPDRQRACLALRYYDDLHRGRDRGDARHLRRLGEDPRPPRHGRAHGGPGGPPMTVPPDDDREHALRNALGAIADAPGEPDAAAAGAASARRPWTARAAAVASACCSVSPAWQWPARPPSSPSS